MTPLHWAVERGCCGTVETLLKHGANPNMESKFDKTPLEIASENGRPDIFEILQVQYYNIGSIGIWRSEQGS